MKTHSILLFAASDDDVSLRGFARSIGLSLLNPHAYRMTVAENERSFDNPAQGGYFSFMPVDTLHKHPHPNIGLCEALDPLILYIRPRYVNGLLIAGQLQHYTDVKAMAKQTKPYFQKLRKWVASNWRLRSEDDYYIGPHADGLLTNEGAITSYLPPHVSVEEVFIPPVTRI